ncbi:proton-coupled amino acid transporter-like protein CG1139 isoform X2 [Harmonia axyridis]|uniref:proton-coupled amino acid transporter-like protein CG1139 isoform X2 n=1 Tax=Harmonia axyridis TaxID=115357 RepID=UPI001E2757D0|nr:proton-coupled amino acid transporter-like protein CG1139 isoform X2 [Harmonia axyridis]
MVDNGTSTLGIDYPPEDPETDYDPYSKKKPKQPAISNVQAFFFLIHGVVGTGILQAGFVFREGWIIGIIMTVSIGIICAHCQYILFKAKYRVCKTMKVPYMKYALSVERAFEFGPIYLRRYSRLSYYLVDGCFILTQLGLCCLFGATALRIAPVADGLFRNWLDFEVNMSILFHTSIFIPLLLSAIMINLRIVAQFAVLGVILLIASIFIFFGYVAQDFEPTGSFEMLDVELITLPIYIATLVFSFESVTVLIYLDHHLKSPRTFLKPYGIMTKGMLLIIFMQCILGISLYWKFDFDSLMISNIPIYFRTNEILAVSTGLYSIYSFISYGLHEYIFVEVMWRKTKKRSTCTRIFVCALPVMVSGTYMLSKAYTELIFPECFVTAILGTVVPILGIIIPVLMDISLNWPHNFKRAKLIYIKNIFLLLFGLLSIFCNFIFCLLPRII